MKNFPQDENGTTAIEYGLIAVMIVTAISTVVLLIGSKVIPMFSKVNDAIPS